ncbi:MAG: AsmA family protein [Alphaproteobacteria bacterium]|nr:AsmA family protein [Alphaproteobacteria bacterium]MDD9920239.1 AsmA family protein [Alphaproteobacteria bacterium]
MAFLKFVFKFSIVLILVCVGIVLFAGGGLVKYMVNFHSERLTGLKMTVAGAELNVLGGQIVLNNLAISNPKGFENPHAATIENIQVKLQPKTFLEDVVVVDYVGIKGTRVQFEGDLNKNNVQSIQAVLAKKVEEVERGGEYDDYEENSDSDKSSQKQVAIRQLLMKDNTITFHLGGMEKGISSDVSDVELTNIGTTDQGASVAEVLDKILLPLFENMHKEIVKALSNPQGLIDQVKDKLGKALGDLF